MLPSLKQCSRSAKNRLTKSKFMIEQDQHLSPKPPPLPASVTRASRKTRTGEVISSSMNKTIVVRTVTRVPHRKLGKIVNKKKKFSAHEEENKAKTATTVSIR